MPETNLQPKELARIQELLNEGRDKDWMLNQFEREFLDSIGDRIDRYADSTKISEKQWAVLEKIEDKLQGRK